MDALRRRLPSRNWRIFWGVVGSAGALAGYDSYARRQQQRRLREVCAPFRDEPIPVFLEPAQATVFVAPTHWARYWFTNYVAPVLDAGAVEYETFEPRGAGGTRRAVRELIWRAKDQLQARLAAPRFFKDPSDVVRNIYDPGTALVAVGANAWREVLRGLAEGCFINRDTYTATLVSRERDRITKALVDERAAAATEAEAAAPSSAVVPPVTRQGKAPIEGTDAVTAVAVAAAAAVTDTPHVAVTSTVGSGGPTLLERDVLQAAAGTTGATTTNDIETSNVVSDSPDTVTTTDGNTSAYNPHRSLMAAATTTKQKQKQVEQETLAQQQQLANAGVDEELEKRLATIDAASLLAKDAPIDYHLYDMTQMPLNLQLPMVGFVPASNLRGWRSFPKRVAGFFNERWTTQWVGEAAVKVVRGRGSEFRVNHDEFTGWEHVYEDKEWTDTEKSETVVPDVPWLLASRLYVFRDGEDEIEATSV